MVCMGMKVIVGILVLLVVLVSANYSITGEVVSDDDGTLGFFERIRNFFKGLFFSEVEESVGTVAKVAVDILPGDGADSDGLIACNTDARICGDGSVVVRGGSDCEFEACSGGVVCSEDSRGVGACIEIYQPVCGDVRVDCITAPCDFVKETFPNSCFACLNERVNSYVDGEC